MQKRPRIKINHRIRSTRTFEEEPELKSKKKTKEDFKQSRQK